MALTMEQLTDVRARFSQFDVHMVMFRDALLFRLAGSENNYAYLRVRNNEYKSGVHLYLYPTKGSRVYVKFAEFASYKTYAAIKKDLRKGSTDKDVSFKALRKHMVKRLEDDMAVMLDILEAHASDVLYKQHWQHGYLVDKNREKFGYDGVTIAKRCDLEYGNDVAAAESAPETETTKSCISADSGRARHVAEVLGSILGGSHKVKLTGDAGYDLANCIQQAARVYEASYDNAGAETKRVTDQNDLLRATAEANGQELAMSAYEWGAYEKFQRLTIHEAVTAVTPEHLVQPVYLLVSYTWNDALDWAKEIMASYEGK